MSNIVAIIPGKKRLKPSRFLMFLLRSILTLSSVVIPAISAKVGIGKKAVEVIENGSFDLVLLDIEMPEMDGTEVLRHVRNTYSKKQLPVIMVTANSQSTKVVEALDIGANDYVSKPLDIASLLARIRSQLD